MAAPDLAIRAPVEFDDAWKALRDLMLRHLHDGVEHADADAMAAAVVAAARNAKAELLDDGIPAVAALAPFLAAQLDTLAARTRPRAALNGLVPCVALGDGAVHAAGGRYEQVVPLAFAYRAVGGERAWY